MGDLGDMCAALGLSVVFIVWGYVAWASPPRPKWYRRRRDFRQWELEITDTPEEKQP